MLKIAAYPIEITLRPHSTVISDSIGPKVSRVIYPDMFYLYKVAVEKVGKNIVNQKMLRNVPLIARIWCKYQYPNRGYLAQTAHQI